MNVTWPYSFTNTPMSQNVQAGDIFEIYKTSQAPNNLIYQGIVAQGVNKLLLNPIFQQFVPPLDYESYFGVQSYEEEIDPIKFYVKNGGNISQYDVSWGYGFPNKLIDIQVGNVQDYYAYYLPIIICMYGSRLEFVKDRTTIEYSSFPKNTAFIRSINLSNYNRKDTDLSVRMYSCSKYQNTILHPLPCSEGYTHCLYFLKRDGSIGWVFCKGRSGEKINAERAQITIADTTTNLNPTIENYQVQHYRSWKFNTGFLTKQQARKLADLFVSPRVWLFDTDGNMIGNVVVTDKSFEIKDKRVSEAPISYTINVREAETKKIIMP